MIFIRPLLNAFKDAFSSRFLVPFILLFIWGGICFSLKFNPFVFWLLLILHTCFVIGYFTEMIRSYLTDDAFYPPLSWVLFWMGGKVLVVLLSLFLIHILFIMYHHQAVPSLVHFIPIWKSIGIFWFYFLLAMPFLYQFITTFSFVQLVCFRQIFKIFIRYFMEFVCLIFQLIFVSAVEIITITTLLPFGVKLIPTYQQIFKTPALMITSLPDLPFSVWCVCLFFAGLILYFTFIKFSLVGQTFGRIHQKERDLYETEHPSVHPEAMSHFSRHYTFEEPLE